MMNPVLILTIFVLLVVVVCYLALKLLGWLHQDPREAILDSDFRRIKREEKTLARGYINPEED